MLSQGPMSSLFSLVVGYGTPFYPCYAWVLICSDQYFYFDNCLSPLRGCLLHALYKIYAIIFTHSIYTVCLLTAASSR
jgi:hypothetical protein